MISQRDDIETFARATDLLFQIREPAELAQHFLAHVTAVFGADAGVFFLAQEGDAHVSALGIEPETARNLATRLGRELVAAGESCRVLRLDTEQTGTAWPNALAAALAEGPEPHGVLALFSARADAFDAARDARLADLLARHAAAALARAALDARTRRQAERLKLQAEELERVRRALERHSREVERSLALRSRYFAVMSHELRTPINAIVGYNDLLQQGLYGELTPRQAEVAAKVGASAKHLLALANDLLDLSKIEAGRIEIRRHPIDLSTLITETAAVVEGDARGKGLELHVHCPESVPWIESDAARLRQIMLNLLSNAVKFTDKGSITVEVAHLRERESAPYSVPLTCTPGSSGWVAIVVRDTGRGIPDERIEEIFGEFVQLPGSEGDGQGTGLGLAISSRLARLLGGDLTVDSEVGVHSTFILFLPCPAPPGPESRAS
ncbi:MAG TPA: ATP-binding protein [Longimicrobiales bacterium]